MYISVCENKMVPVKYEFSWTISLDSRRYSHILLHSSSLENISLGWLTLSLLICNHFYRKVVLQPEKGGFISIFFSGSPTRKRIQVCRTTFLKPEKNSWLQNHFSRITFLEKWLQNKCLNGYFCISLNSFLSWIISPFERFPKFMK